MVAKNFRKKKSNIRVNQELLISLEENDDLEEPGLDETAEAIVDPLKAIRIINRYEEIIKSK